MTVITLSCDLLSSDRFSSIFGYKAASKSSSGWSLVRPVSRKDGGFSCGRHVDSLSSDRITLGYSRDFQNDGWRCKCYRDIITHKRLFVKGRSPRIEIAVMWVHLFRIRFGHPIIRIKSAAGKNIIRPVTNFLNPSISTSPTPRPRRTFLQPQYHMEWSAQPPEEFFVNHHLRILDVVRQRESGQGSRSGWGW